MFFVIVSLIWRNEETIAGFTRGCVEKKQSIKPRAVFVKTIESRMTLISTLRQAAHGMGALEHLTLHLFTDLKGTFIRTRFTRAQELSPIRA